MQILKAEKSFKTGVRWKRGAVFMLMLCGSLLVLSMRPPQQFPVAKEYQVKALFLFNFTQFVEWPPESFPDENAPIILGILGEDPFGPYLEEIIKDEMAGNHPLIVRRFENVEEVENCHILYIGISRKEALKEALAALKSQTILTVSDAENFTRLGGMIQLFIRENKIGIRVGLEATREAGLTISSKLLRLAEIDSANK